MAEPARPGPWARATRLLGGDPSSGAPGVHLFAAVAFTLLLALNVADALWGDGLDAWIAIKLVVFGIGAPLAWRTWVLARRRERAAAASSPPT